MRHTIIPTVIAGLGTGVVVSGFAAILYHNVFFYTADGYMSPKTAMRLGLVDYEEASSSGGLAFKKSGPGIYAYREGRVTAFIGRTSHTRIDLVAECEHLGGCELRK
jgi:hypothetical protein